MTADRLKRAGDKDAAVVACAADLFLERGIAHVKMVDIARAAHVGVATVYRHFSTKASVAVAAAAYLWERYNRRILALVESDGFLASNGLERMGVLLGSYCELYTSQADFAAFLDELDHVVAAEQVPAAELCEYSAQLDSFYPIFEDAYLLGRMDGSIVHELDFRTFYLALAHALMGVAQKLSRGEIIPSDDFSSYGRELQSIVSMAMWSLAGPEARVPSMVAVEST